MEALKESSVYVRKFDRKIAKYNHSFQLPDYFAPMIGDKKEVVIAELAAGLINTIGDSFKDVKVTVLASDILVDEYQKLLSEHRVELHTPIRYEDIESLSYGDDYFDIVHCVNALDHTPSPLRALLEMQRICKPGGYIYLRHSPYQMKRYGGHHLWNIYLEGEDCVFESRDDKFKLLLLGGFKSRMELFGKEELIISICQKPI